MPGNVKPRVKMPVVAVRKPRVKSPISTGILKALLSRALAKADSSLGKPNPKVILPERKFEVPNGSRGKRVQSSMGVSKAQRLAALRRRQPAKGMNTKGLGRR
jgi:hypothetical protein